MDDGQEVRVPYRAGGVARGSVRSAVRLALVVAGLAVLAAASPGSAAAAKSPKPAVYKPKWHLVTQTALASIEPVLATDRYVAIFPYRGRPLLIDEQTGRRKMLSLPACPPPTYARPDFDAAFGGPWLSIGGCSLYDLNAGRWVSFQVSSQCRGSCVPVAFGRYWVKVVSDEGVGATDPQDAPSDYYLQNIRTGQFERDPATPGGTVFDDLNASSGSTPLCPPLSYPSVTGRAGTFLGSIGFYDQFALTFGGRDPQSNVYRLRRCGSRLNLLLSNTATNAFPTPPDFAPVASSRAVIWSADGYTLRGWLLPSMRRFTIPICNPNDTPNDPHCVRFPIQPKYIYEVMPVAVTDRTIYAIREADHPQLWSAPLPTPKQLTR
jgi:hypothetical protein